MRHAHVHVCVGLICLGLRKIMEKKMQDEEAMRLELKIKEDEIKAREEEVVALQRQLGSKSDTCPRCTAMAVARDSTADGVSDVHLRGNVPSSRVSRGCSLQGLEVPTHFDSNTKGGKDALLLAR